MPPSRIFKIVEPAVVTLSMLKIRNGFQREIVMGSYGIYGAIGEGGGIYNSGALTLNDSSVESSRISDEVCDLDYCRRSPISMKGAGIFNSGTAFLTGCSVEGNFGEVADGSGGGIYNSGRMTLVGTAVSQNSGYLGPIPWLERPRTLQRHVGNDDPHRRKRDGQLEWLLTGDREPGMS